MRSGGLLIPVFAMRHADDFGIGDTRAVREAIDFCAENGFKVLQILPIHETFLDHSPYNPISSRALSPAYVHLHPEEVPGLREDDLKVAAPDAWRSQLRQGAVKHGAVHPLKIQVLERAWHHFQNQPELEQKNGMEKFLETERDWLESYTMFRLLIREYEGNADWQQWRPDHQSMAGATDWLQQHPDRDRLEEVRSGYAFIQWVAEKQWLGVRRHAEDRDVWLMGEISFGVGRGSADVWAFPELFDTEWNMGTRPLAHFDTNKDASVWGQNWDLPPYRWENHRLSGFHWLRGRVARQRKFFHMCRLDHLRGYFRVYVFPWRGGARHSEFSTLTPLEAALKTGGKLPRFLPGPDDYPDFARINERQGRELLGIIREEAGPMDLVAEIMGEMPEYMSLFLEELPLANLAFPQLERSPDQDPAEVELRELALATYANHDNAPLAMSYLHLLGEARKDPSGKASDELEWLLGFAGWEEPAPDLLTEELLDALQQALFNSRSRLAVLMCSDLLGLPLRFNLPGSYGLETWCERLPLTFAEIQNHPSYGARLAKVKRMLRKSGREAARK